MEPDTLGRRRLLSKSKSDKWIEAKFACSPLAVLFGEFRGQRPLRALSSLDEEVLIAECRPGLSVDHDKHTEFETVDGSVTGLFGGSSPISPTTQSAPETVSA